MHHDPTARAAVGTVTVMDHRSDQDAAAVSAVGPFDRDIDRDDELARLALAADPDAPIPADAVPFGSDEVGADLLPAWYMPGRLRPPADGRRRRRRVAVVAAIVASLVLVNGVGLCVTYGLPEIAW